MLTIVTWIIFVLPICLLIIHRRLHASRARNHPPHPPGPPGLPFIGHVRFPEHPPWKIFKEWSKTYGSDIIRYNMCGTNLIIVNSFEPAKDLLEKRSGIYSDRDVSRFVMLRELSGLDWTFAMQRYGREWREGRKMFQQELGPEGLKRFRPSAVQNSRAFVLQLILAPDRVMDLIRDIAAERILYTAYGIEICDRDDPYIHNSELITAAVASALTPGNYLVDLIPLLRYVPGWFPGAGFQRQARIWRKAAREMLDVPFETVAKRMAEDTSPDCVAKTLIERCIRTARDPLYTEGIVKSTLASMYGAGIDTIAGHLVFFFQAMALYPEVQKKARDALDEVCRGRLPEFTDHDRLIYIQAIIKECLRWSLVVAMNLPHRCSQDDVYNGYFIPEGSIVVVNIWAILHDSTSYESPEEFIPERYLKTNSHGESVLNPDVPDPFDTVFGFGRRACPGRFMAYETLWIIITTTLSAVEILKPTDVLGNPLDATIEFEEGFAMIPKAFSCGIRVLSPEHEALLASASQRDQPY